MYVEILTSRSNVDRAKNLQQVLQREGLEFAIAIDEPTMDLPMATIVLLEPDETDLYYALGFRAAQRVPLIVLREKDTRVPELPDSSRILIESDSELELELRKALVDLAGIQGLEAEVPTEAQALRQWLADDLDRLGTLDAARLATAISYELELSGFNTSRESRRDAVDIWAQLPDLDVSWAVECRRKRAGRPLDIGDVRKAYDVCSARRSKFLLLVTNSSFTRAAKAWATRAVPAIHLVDFGFSSCCFQGVLAQGPGGGGGVEQANGVRGREELSWRYFDGS